LLGEIEVLDFSSSSAGDPDEDAHPDGYETYETPDDTTSYGTCMRSPLRSAF
jgi:hypothetical protein